MSGLFDYGRQLFLEGDIAWLTDTIRVMLVDHATYTPNLATDQFFDDITLAARYGNTGDTPGTPGERADCPALGSKTSTDGVADAADTTFTAPTGSVPLASLVVFKDTGSDATSPLICQLDSGTGLPITPNGGPITAAWSSGGNGIFKL